MIGFEMSAYGAGRFHSRVTNWSEGPIWIAKLAFYGMKGPDQKGAAKAEIRAIESGLKSIKEKLL